MPQKLLQKANQFRVKVPPYIYKNPSQNFFQEGLMCSGRESNPYGHFCPRDFKSRVSTYSTTRAIRVQI